MKSSHLFPSLVLSATVAVSTPYIAAAQPNATTPIPAANAASTERSREPARELLRGKLAQTYAVADFDADRIPDLALADFLSDTLHVLTGDGHGRFHSTARLLAPGGPRAIVAADLNADTVPDLVVACFLSGEVRIYLGSPAAGDLFAEPDAVQLSPGLSSILLRDFDGDGHLDLGVANFLSGEISLLRGLGGGAFAAARTIGEVAGTTLLLARDRRDAPPDLIAFGVVPEPAHVLGRDPSGAFTDRGTIDQAAALVREGDRQALKEISGDGQFGRSGAELRDPFIVESLDALGRRTAAHSVVFSSLLGHGAWRNETLRLTDEQGRATNSLQLAASPETHVLAAARDGGEISVFGALSVMPREWFLTRLESVRRDLTPSHSAQWSTANDVGRCRRTHRVHRRKQR